MNYVVEGDIPVPESVLKEHKRQLHYWYEHHKTETRVEPYRFYYDGHLITLAFDESQPTHEDRMVYTSVVLSSLVLVATTSILSYYVYVS